jgi:hypothetical protein
MGAGPSRGSLPAIGGPFIVRGGIPGALPETGESRPDDGPPLLIQLDQPGDAGLDDARAFD